MSRKTSFAKQENDGCVGCDVKPGLPPSRQLRSPSSLSCACMSHRFGTFFGPAKVVVFRRSNPPLAESEGKAPSGRPKDHKPSSKGVEQKPRPRLPPVLQVDEVRLALQARLLVVHSLFICFSPVFCRRRSA